MALTKSPQCEEERLLLGWVEVILCNALTGLSEAAAKGEGADYDLRCPKSQYTTPRLGCSDTI